MNSNARIETSSMVLEKDRVQACPVQLIETPNQLDLIHEPDKSLVLWQRQIPADVQNFLKQLTRLDAEDMRFNVQPDSFEETIKPKFADLPLSNEGGVRWLTEDISVLVKAFAEITGTPDVEVRLEWIDGDACWKFHRDYVAYRLVTTYAGSGTEWVPPTWSRQAIAHQQSYTGPLEKLRSGHVAIFKGCRNSTDDGIVHRSPILGKSGERRLFLCLNVARPQN